MTKLAFLALFGVIALAAVLYYTFWLGVANLLVFALYAGPVLAVLGIEGLLRHKKRKHSRQADENTPGHEQQKSPHCCN